jgi:hypothetical protein
MMTTLNNLLLNYAMEEEYFIDELDSTGLNKYNA